MTDIEKVSRKANCCACRRPMRKSRFVNFVNLDKKATWESPVWTNVALKQGIPRINRAVAVVCDSCIKRKMPVRFAIEIRGEDIIYHLVGKLEDVFPIKPEMLEEYP